MKFLADDFEKEPRGHLRFDIWKSKKRIQTSMGMFDVELREVPDDELLRKVSELASFVSDQNEEVLDKVYEHYERTSEHRHWMKICGVPVGLARKSILPHLRSRTIFALREKTGVTGSIFIDPEWDTEHKINLVVQSGVLIFKDL